MSWRVFWSGQFAGPAVRGRDRRRMREPDRRRRGQRPGREPWEQIEDGLAVVAPVGDGDGVSFVEVAKRGLEQIDLCVKQCRAFLFPAFQSALHDKTERQRAGGGAPVQGLDGNRAAVVVDLEVLALEGRVGAPSGAVERDHIDQDEVGGGVDGDFGRRLLCEGGEGRYKQEGTRTPGWETRRGCGS